MLTSVKEVLLTRQDSWITVYVFRFRFRFLFVWAPLTLLQTAGAAGKKQPLPQGFSIPYQGLLTLFAETQSRP